MDRLTITADYAEQPAKPKQGSNLLVPLIVVSIIAIIATSVSISLTVMLVTNDHLQNDDVNECQPNSSCQVNTMSGKSFSIPDYTPGLDCGDIMDAVGPISGVYKIQPKGASAPFNVYCEMTDSGAWTVIQRRQDGSVSFIRTWAAYKAGFGNIDGEYWIGNDNIHYLTNQVPYKLRIDLEKGDGLTAYTEYNPFMIEDEYNNYTLHLGKPSGTAGDSLIQTFANNNGQPFSTYDVDNDQNPYSCANSNYAGWWFESCTAGNLNGFYYTINEESSYQGGLYWYSWNLNEPLKTVTMKIQAAD
ncbi:fibrinogen-like protein [Saccoglossus kowalevskii]|uniref:Fibrinogen-like protein n=1 Tax=Saccoglossus kowalevskii TaxID=10224 RepID=D1LX12_SACKO|nr:fibrinogen-like protein [Saccoglossus kowalevskii]ACY92518.1 fibrinogen-like protein [Saccoglossus kowalevskii]